MSSPLARALASGLAGAAAVNLLNESARRFSRQAPRLDLVGERGLARVVRRAGRAAPRGRTRYLAALAGDVASNTLYYALVGPSWGRGAALGAGAGVGAVALVPQLGLGRETVARSGVTKALTVGWYLAGGLAAAAVARQLARRADAGHPRGPAYGGALDRWTRRRFER